MMVAVTTKTPCSSKTNNNKKSSLYMSSWQDTGLSTAVARPQSTKSWNNYDNKTPVPSATRLVDDEDESLLLSPTTPASSNNRQQFFNFATPKAASLQNFFTTTTTPTASTAYHVHQRGYLHDDYQRSTHNKKQIIKNLMYFVVFWFFGAFSWNTLHEQTLHQQQTIEQQQHHDMMKMAIVPPSNSPSERARNVFAKHYGNPHHHSPPYDWGANLPLYVILESSIHDDFHSFTDDTSIAYEEGKQYCFGLVEYLENQYSASSTLVRVTSYYTLQEQGLDYVAKNMVTPDGSKTMIQIQFLTSQQQEEDQQEADIIEKLQQSILEYGKKNSPSYLNVHDTSLYWNPSSTTNSNTMSTRKWNAYACVVIAAVFVLLSLSLLGTDTATNLMSGGSYTSTQTWMMLIVAGTSTCISASSIALAYFVKTTTMTSTSLFVMFILSFCLAVYYSKIQIDYYQYRKEEKMGGLVHYALLQDGSLIFSLVASLFMLSSPTAKSVSLVGSIAVLFTTAFHIVGNNNIMETVTMLMNHRYYSNMNAARKITSPMSRTTTSNRGSTGTDTLRWLGGSLGILGFLFLVVTAVYDNEDGAVSSGIAGIHMPINQQFHDFGNHFGFGRMTPYRILFDGHRAKRNMTSLAGYDIVQTIIDELTGIYIADETTQEGETEAVSIPAGSGSTHIAEEFTEVQHLIKNLVDTLKHFKAEQQKEFDRHHQRRKERWSQLQFQKGNDLEEDIRCDYNVNGGISATTYTGLAVLENSRIPQSLYSAATICRGMEPRCPSEALHLLNVIEDETTTSDRLATYVNVNLGVSPFSREGIEWLRLARETIDRVGADPRVVGDVEIHIDGHAAIFYDHLDQQLAQQESHEGGNTTNNWWQISTLCGFLFFALGLRMVVLTKAGSRMCSNKSNNHRLHPIDTNSVSSKQQDSYLSRYDEFILSPQAP